MNTPKALLQIGAETFLATIIRKLREAGISRIAVVTGKHHSEIDLALKIDPDVESLFNERYTSGQFSSLRTGINKLADEASEILVWPVDIPLVESSTVEKLLKRHIQGKSPLTIPVITGLKGHPIVLGSEAIKRVLSLDDHHTGKELQILFNEQIEFVEVEDPGILRDIDTPEDYENFIAGRRLQ